MRILTHPDHHLSVMQLDLTDEEAAALLGEPNGIIDGDRYFLSRRIKTLKAIRSKIRPEPPKASHPWGEPVRRVVVADEALRYPTGDRSEKTRWWR